ncbi:hypothetical protein KY332_04420 [Candidatus Woesearchaeota archaeon]|nr:hypothetical protein [Candidatus Woesearchaeota archaeon]
MSQIITGFFRRKEDLQTKVSKCIAKYEESAGKRKPILPHQLRNVGAKEVYRRRQEDHQFLETMVSYLDNRPRAKTKLESGEHPELMVDEVRKVLQKTLYRDFWNFYKNKKILKAKKKEPSFVEFEQKTNLVRDFAASLKRCFDCYLDICKTENTKFFKFSEYGVLQLPVGNPNGAGFYNLVNEKQLGLDFDHDELQKFKNESAKIGVDFNPSIPDAYHFLDSCMEYILEAAKGLIEVDGFNTLAVTYHLTQTEAYQRIRFLKKIVPPDPKKVEDTQEKEFIVPESKAYYYARIKSNGNDGDWLATYKIEWKRYCAKLEKLGIKKVPKGVITLAEVTVMGAKIKEIPDPEKKKIKVEYRTQSGRHKKINP